VMGVVVVGGSRGSWAANGTARAGVGWARWKEGGITRSRGGVGRAQGGGCTGFLPSPPPAPHSAGL
jgi:hypothetical protein